MDSDDYKDDEESLQKCLDWLKQYGSDLDAAQKYLETLVDNFHVAPGWIDAGAANLTAQTIVSPALQARLFKTRGSNPESDNFLFRKLNHSREN